MQQQHNIFLYVMRKSVKFEVIKIFAFISFDKLNNCKFFTINIKTNISSKVLDPNKMSNLRIVNLIGFYLNKKKLFNRKKDDSQFF